MRILKLLTLLLLPMVLLARDTSVINPAKRLIKIGAFNYYPGIFRDSDGIVKGFFVDMLDEMARQENWQIEYVYGSWNDGLERIKKGEVDVLTSVAYTDERALYMDYPKSHLLTVWGEVYVPENSVLSGIQDFENKKIGIMKGDFNGQSFVNLINQFHISCELIEFDSFETIFEAINNEIIDAGVVNNTYGAAKQKECSLKSTGVVFNPFDLNFTVAKGKNKDLLERLDYYISTWKQNASSPYHKALHNWSYKKLNVVQVIPDWLITALSILISLMFFSTIFILLLRKKIRQATAKIQESENYFRILYEEAPIASQSLGLTGSILDINKTWCELLGYSKEEVLNTDIVKYITPEYQIVFPTVMNEFLSRGEIHGKEFDFVTKQGKIVNVAVEGAILYDDNGKFLHSHCMLYDISVRKTAERKIREAEERLRLALEATSDGLWDWDKENDILYWSPRTFEMLGYKPYEFETSFRKWEELLHPDDKISTWLKIKEQIENTGSFSIEFRLNKKDGQWVWILGRGKVVEWHSDGLIKRVVGTHEDITEKKQTELQLKESEHKYKTVANFTYDWEYWLNENKQYNYISPSCLNITGYSKKEFIANPDLLLNIIHPEDINKVKSHYIDQFYDHQDFASLEFRIITRDKRIKWISHSCRNVFDENNVWRGKRGSNRDITKQILAEEFLRKLSRAVEHSPVSIIITNKDTEIEYVNPKFEQVTGYSRQEVIGKDLSNFQYNKNDLNIPLDSIIKGKEWNGKLLNKKKSGELFWESVNISPIKDDDDNIIHFVVVKEDITQKVEYEEQLNQYRNNLEELVRERTDQLQKQNVFLRTLIDTIPNPIFVKNTDGCYTEINKAFETFYNVPREEVLGKKVDYLAGTEIQKLTNEIDSRILQKHETVVYETYHIDQHGINHPTLIYKSSFGVKDKPIEGIAGLVIDITDQKELESRTQAAFEREKELNEMKTHFISMASHEFRTPLTSILASADLLELYGKTYSEEKFKKTIKKIQNSVVNMTGLLDDVLTVSRTDRGKIAYNPTEFDLYELCQEVIDDISLFITDSHNLSFDYTGNQKIVTADAGLIQHILLNLLTNAVKYSPNGGRIGFNTNVEANIINFSISDNGVGIAPDEIKHIFEPFYRTNNSFNVQGSGLGLTIVKKYVEIHNGNISVQSELNEGTIFRVSLKCE